MSNRLNDKYTVVVNIVYIMRSRLRPYLSTLRKRGLSFKVFSTQKCRLLDCRRKMLLADIAEVHLDFIADSEVYVYYAHRECLSLLMRKEREVTQFLHSISDKSKRVTMVQDMRQINNE
jgi:hypothetical protein